MNSTTATPNAGNTTNALANITTADREWVLKSELRIFDARGQFSTEACCAIEMARADSRGEQI